MQGERGGVGEEVGEEVEIVGKLVGVNVVGGLVGVNVVGADVGELVVGAEVVGDTVGETVHVPGSLRRA